MIKFQNVFKFNVSLLLATSLFSTYSLAQNTCPAGSTDIKDTKASGLVAEYISAQDQRVKEVMELLGVAKEYYKKSVDSQKRDEILAATVKTVGVIEMIYGLAKDPSIAIDGVGDFLWGSKIEEDAKNIRSSAYRELLKMEDFVINERQSTNKVIAELKNQSCVSNEKYLEIAGKLRKLATGRLDYLKKFATLTLKQVDSIKLKRNVKVGVKTAVAVATGLATFSMVRTMKLNSDTILFLGLPTILTGTVTAAVSVSALETYMTSNSDIDRIEAINNQIIQEVTYL
ncbi:MAG: hypothetical protein L6Q37_03205 [Bdellovibrionaceae bacterium]|nr:hypothetical protein [Pseudobdellovibrionaceae bacterium]